MRVDNELLSRQIRGFLIWLENQNHYAANSVVMLFFVAIFGLISVSCYNYSNSIKAKLIRQTDFNAWLEDVAPIVQSIQQKSKNDTATRIEDAAILNEISKTSKEANLSLSKIDPSDARVYRVWMSDQYFEDVMLWTKQLNDATGVNIDAIYVTRGRTARLVNVVMTLEF